jgi:hypothetical protein
MGQSFTFAAGLHQHRHFWVSSPVRFLTILYCLRFETSLLVSFYEVFNTASSRGLANSSFTSITLGEPYRSHHPRMCCHGNVFNFMVTKPAVMGTCLVKPLASNGLTLLLQLSGVMSQYMVKLLLSIVTAGIEALIISGSKFIYACVKEVCRL